MLAAAFALEKEANGGSVEHLRREPLTPRPQVNFYNVPGAPKAEEGKDQGARADKLPGFYMPQGGEDEEDGESEDDDEVAGEESDETSEVSGVHVVYTCVHSNVQDGRMGFLFLFPFSALPSFLSISVTGL